MDELEIGVVYTLANGTNYRYKGGPPNDRKSWEPIGANRGAEQRTPATSQVTDFLRSLAHGASLNLSDEMAGARARTPWTAISPPMMVAGLAREFVDPAPETQAAKQQINETRERSPATSFAGEMLGGAALPVVGAGKVGAAVTARTGHRILGAAAGGAFGGATGGGLVGFAEGETLAGRAFGGGAGTVLGAGVGGPLGLIGSASSRRFNQRTHAADNARHVVDRSLREAGHPNIESARGALGDLGEGSVLADLSPTIGREVKAAVNQAPSLVRDGGPVSFVRARDIGSGGRHADALRQAADLPNSYGESLDFAEAVKKRVSADHFQPLEAAHPVVSGLNVRNALQHPDIAIFAREVDPAIVPASNALSQMGVPAHVIAQAKGLYREPTFVEAQGILQRLWDAFDGSTLIDERRRLGEAYRLFRGALAEDVPGFDAAQTAWARSQSVIDAHALGRTAAGKSADDASRALYGLDSTEAKDAFRQGLLDAFEVQLRGGRGTGGGLANSLETLAYAQGPRPAGGMDAAGIADKTEIMQKLRLLVQDDAAFGRMLREQGREGRWAETWNAISGNSTSAQQLSDIFRQIPQSKQAWYRTLLNMVGGQSRDERILSAELIGRTLLSDGDEAALSAAQQLYRRRLHAAGIVSGLLGATGGRALPLLNRGESSGSKFQLNGLLDLDDEDDEDDGIY
jgi:hypothetical protein